MVTVTVTSEDVREDDDYKDEKGEDSSNDFP